jgi:epoxyqueuosine reductase
LSEISILTQEVKVEVQRLGFQLSGVTTCDPPAHLDFYERWLAAGYHGEMGYLATERNLSRRSDPRQLLPECKSILVLGIRYPAQRDNTAEINNAPLKGKVASYAWGEDYHKVLPERLHAVVRFIEDRVGHEVPNRWYTDTGPILEREMAQRAGLGWIGKNTCLIHPKKGSYFLLAEILLGIELEVDSPFPHDRCGSCTRCIEACPTGCILPDRRLDASRCISYLTIELKGPIRGELRPKTGDWVFGCDVCQQVCPWNQRFAKPEGDPAFAPWPSVPRPNLISEITLTAQEFNLKFKGSPVKRAKRRGYLRNVAVALGNTGDAQAVPALVKALRDGEPFVRGHAAWALGQIGGRVAAKVLHNALQEELDADVQAEIHAALEAIKK